MRTVQFINWWPDEWFGWLPKIHRWTGAISWLFWFSILWGPLEFRVWQRESVRKQLAQAQGSTESSPCQ